MVEGRNKQQLMKRVNDFLISYFRWLATVLLLTVLLIGAFFIVFPKYQEVHGQIEQALTDQESKRLAVTKYLSDLKQLKQSYSQVNQSDRERIGRFLPSQPQAEQLMVELDIIAKRLGVVVTSLKVGDSGKAGANIFSGQPGVAATSSALTLGNDISGLKVSMAVKNVDYNLFKNLLAALEKHLRLVDVQRVSFSPAEGSANLELIAYYLK